MSVSLCLLAFLGQNDVLAPLMLMDTMRGVVESATVQQQQTSSQMFSEAYAIGPCQVSFLFQS